MEDQRRREVEGRKRGRAGIRDCSDANRDYNLN